MIPGHHTNSTFLEFVNDENGIPLGPVAMFSPLLNTKNMTQDQVVMCLHQHVHILNQCRVFHKTLTNNVCNDTDISMLKTFFDSYVEFFKEYLKNLVRCKNCQQVSTIVG